MQRPLRIGIMAGGFSIRHTAAALLEDGYDRLKPFFEPTFFWVDTGNERERYMKYLPDWEAIKADQLTQLRRIGWPEQMIVNEPFAQKRLWELLRDTATDVLYVIMHGGIVGPTAIRMVNKRFYVNHPAFEIPTTAGGMYVRKIPEISRGAGAPERLVSVTQEFLRENGLKPRLQMVLIKGIQAEKGNPLSLDSGPIKATSPTAALRLWTPEEAADPATMPARIAELMEMCATLSAPVIRNHLVKAVLTPRQALRRGMSFKRGLEFGYRPIALLNAGFKLPSREEMYLRKMLNKQMG